MIQRAYIRQLRTFSTCWPLPPKLPHIKSPDAHLLLLSLLYPCHHLDHHNPLPDVPDVANFAFLPKDVSSLVGPLGFPGRFARLCCSILESIRRVAYTEES